MIRVQNIYYMLAYAYQTLRQDGLANCGTEDFENTADLLSEILIKGISYQLKRGLDRDYIRKEETLSGVKGKINVSDSIRNQAIVQQRLVCSFDEYSVDTYVNKILKTTMYYLLKADISKERKKRLRNIMLFFKDIEIMDRHQIKWDIRYNRTNQSYQMLVDVCYLVINGLLQTDSKGKVKLNKYLDEQELYHLYEKFILNYYKLEFPELKVSNPRIKWRVEAEELMNLPVMQSDIEIEDGKKVLIIDAKCYEHSMQEHFDKSTIHSNNLYQIFTYVKNRDVEDTGNVSGMLLYAKTDEEEQPHGDFIIAGNPISVRTLDLNLKFSSIASQLDDIAYKYFKAEPKISKLKGAINL